MFKEKITNIEESLTYDDILIKPNYSDVNISEVDLSVNLTNKLTLEVPVFSACMDTVTGYEMARGMILAGGCGPLHKNVTIDENVGMVEKLYKEFGDTKPIAACVGVGNSLEDITRLVKAGANILVVDSAHGHTKGVGDIVELIHKNYPDIYLVAGNVVTGEGAKFLVEKGANAVKVGMGLGSICTTRKVTGIGRGQISALAEVADYCKSRGVLVISDGGMRYADEIMKAIVCGADVVMLGYMLAGCEECPGDVVVVNNEKLKLYRGMGSLGAMEAGSAVRYSKNVVDKFKWVPEGIEGYVKAKGPVKDELHTIAWSLRSAFGYVGCRNIGEVHSKAYVTRVTNSVLLKSGVHGVDKIKN